MLSERNRRGCDCPPPEILWCTVAVISGSSSLLMVTAKVVSLATGLQGYAAVMIRIFRQLSGTLISLNLGYSHAPKVKRFKETYDCCVIEPPLAFTAEVKHDNHFTMMMSMDSHRRKQQQQTR